MQKVKAFAFTIILLMMVVNLIVPRPVVPTFPHKSWQWLKPWPVQVLEGRRPSSHVQVVEAELSRADEIIFTALAAAIAFVLGNSLMELNQSIVDALTSALEREGPGGDGGGGGGGRELEMNF